MMAATLALPTVLPTEHMLNPVLSKIEDLSLSTKPKKKTDEPIGMAYSNILDQSKKRLNSLDAQRVVSVVEECAHKCEIVTLLPFLVENLQRFSVTLGPELITALKEYDRLQQFYMDALKIVRKSRPSSCTSRASSDTGGENVDSSVEYEMAVDNVNSVSASLEQCVRTIARLFKGNPVAMNTVKVQRGERSYEANVLIDRLLGLREELYYRLVTTASEEQEKLKMSHQILKKEKKAKVTIKKLEADLDMCSKEKKDMIHSKNEIIRNLKASIQAIEQESDVVNRKMLNDAKKVEASDLKNSEVMQSKLQQDIITLKQQLQQNINKHRDDELLMRKRKFKIETEVENWLQKYDSDMTEKQQELDDISLVYTEERSQLEQLEERYETLEVEYQRIVEEKRIADEERLRQEEDMKRMVKAATLLQSFWRSYRCRKALKAKQKKGKKGKGAKKKKR